MVDDFPSFISQTHVAQLQAQTQGITAHIIYFYMSWSVVCDLHISNNVVIN